MTKRPWTPGPWKLAYLDSNSQRVVQGEHIEICTCWHHSVESIEREMEANARLIAAAPELYEALLMYVDNDPSDMAPKARAVLAKAEGHKL